MKAQTTAPALRLNAIRKAYPGVVAVDNVDLEMFPGEILALVGENGAGKSTLAAIAFGEVTADNGSVETDGTVGLVHQHFELVGRLRVWQNVLLGREPRRGWNIDRDAARARVVELSRRNGMQIDPDAFVDELPVGAQQRVELLRELDRNPSILLLDEPTAALAPSEIDAFFATIARLAEAGTAIMIVTHKLQEVISYSDRIAVMRHGRMVAHMRTGETTVDAIARAMVGGELPAVATRSAANGRERVVVERVSASNGEARVDDVDFEICGGEILGIAGVEGNGQSVLADVLGGLIPFRGKIARDGVMRVIPQDRHKEALVMPWSIVENAVLGRQRVSGVHHGMTLDRNRARKDAAWIAQQFDVRAASLDVPVRALSGGNQQKVVVGRALIDKPSFILAYNPTRGIDVGAAALVQSRLIQARNDGAAILLISFDLDEILALSDRVHVLYRGRIAGTFAGDRLDRSEIGRCMGGAK